MQDRSRYLALFYDDDNDDIEELGTRCISVYRTIIPPNQQNILSVSVHHLRGPKAARRRSSSLHTLKAVGDWGKLGGNWGRGDTCEGYGGVTLGDVC